VNPNWARGGDGALAAARYEVTTKPGEFHFIGFFPTFGVAGQPLRPPASTPSLRSLNPEKTT